MKKTTVLALLLFSAFFSIAQEKMYIMKGKGIQGEYYINQDFDELKLSQDSIYVMKNSVASSKFNINNELDSIIFYKPNIVDVVEGDVNGDGQLNILVLGTSQSIKSGSEAFDPSVVATELTKILSLDTSLTKTPYVQSEDIYKTKAVSTIIGQFGTAANVDYFCHSLFQYYHWPEGKVNRKSNLMGTLTKDWDYVVIAADPFMVSTLPDYYSLGVDKIASVVSQGGGIPLLMMMWPKETTSLASINHFEEFTYRASSGASVDLKTIPAGLAWNALPSGKKDISTTHPSPNGAYLAAASIYSQILNKSASNSNYSYDDTIADLVLSTVNTEASKTHFTGERTLITPFSPCNITDSSITGNHTGSSTENGILDGLRWVYGKSTKTYTHITGTTVSTIFNYGRANTYFNEVPSKLYTYDPVRFQYSFGLPMGDNNNGGLGNISMLYGIDKRNSAFGENENGVDIRVATYMIEQNRLPQARAIAIRTLVATLFDEGIITTAYGDSWHLSSVVNKSIAGYMKTMLTGTCELGTEPTDKTSAAWKDWRAHQIGYQTAYKLMYLKQAPACTN